MGQVHRLLMLGVDHQALETLGDDIDVTVLMGGQAKDIGLALPRDVRVIFVDESRSVDSCLNALHREGALDFDAVYAFDDPSMMTGAVIGCVLGARCVPAAVVARFRDKYLQKQELRRAGVVVARHELIPDIRDLFDGYGLRFAKAVLKPVAGQATESTHVVTSTGDVRRIARDCKAKGVKARTFVVEEFIEGKEWFADGIVSSGRIRFASLGRYAKNCLAAVKDRSPVRTYLLDPVADKASYEAAMPVAAKALATLGLADGIFHMELFHRTCGVVFSECAARRAGGPIRDQVRHKFGVDLAYHGVMSLLRPTDEIPVTVVDGVVASEFLPLAEGTLLDHPSREDLLACDGVVGARIFVPKGLRTAPLGGNTIGRMGEFTVHAPTVDEATALLNEVSAWFAERMVVLPLSATMRELRGMRLGRD